MMTVAPNARSSVASARMRSARFRRSGRAPLPGMLVHLCLGLVVGDGLAEAAPVRGRAATVGPDDRAADVRALAVTPVPVVAAPAAVRPRARPPARTPAAMAAPATGRNIFTHFSLACCSQPQPRGGRGAGRGGPPRPVRQA